MSYAKIAETTYVRLLYALLTNGLVQRTTLLGLAVNEQTVYRLLKCAKANEHIQELSITIKVNSRKKIIHYYNITQSGINYLSQSDLYLPDEMLWIKEIPPQTKPINPFGNINRASSRIYRHLLISDSNIFLSSVGAEVLPLLIPFSEPDEDAELPILSESAESGPALSNLNFDMPVIEYCEAKINSEGKTSFAPAACVLNSNGEPVQSDADTPLCSLVLDAIESYKDMEQTFNGFIRNQDSELKYTHIREIKHKLSTGGNAGIVANGKLVGILTHPLKSVIVYEANRMGMRWDKWSTGKDIKIYRQYKNEVGNDKTRKGETGGILLVENSHIFQNLYMNKYGKRGGEEMGGDLASLIIIPTDKNGKRNIKEYMTTETEKQIKEIESAAIESGQFRKRVGRYERVFPLESTEGVMTTVGIYIDAIKIRELKSAVEALKVPYQIICYEWQCEYYSRVLPDAEYVILEEAQEEET